MSFTMLEDVINIPELTKRRNPAELLRWVELKWDQIEFTDEGKKALIILIGLVKQLMEEVYPLTSFGSRKFGNTDKNIYAAGY